jgi:hypothetical protein
MHMTGPGGRLDVHIDFNYVRDRKLYRRLNILIYLNERWDDSWGGQIELWDKDVSRCEVAVTPLLNRCVLFETSDISFHGVRPIASSPGRVRKSFAAYYYTHEPPPNWSGQDHSTVFKARPDEADRIGDAKRVGDDREARIGAAAGRKERGIDDIQILDAVGTIVAVENARFRVVSKSTSAADMSVVDFPDRREVHDSMAAQPGSKRLAEQFHALLQLFRVIVLDHDVVSALRVRQDAIP